MNAMTYARKSRAQSAPSLKIGPQNDAFEQEADRKADEVMSLAGSTAQWSLSRMSIAPPVQRKCSCGGSAGAEGECEECKAKGAVQRKASGTVEPSHAPAIVHDVIGSSGKPLDRATRNFFEPRFGHDFSRVRIHSDVQAAASARAVGALAYTVGSNVVFGSGQYAPHSASGRKLLAHELAHVVQQGPASPLPQPANRQPEALLKSGPGLHRKAIAHKPLTPLSRTTSGPRVQRSFLSGLLDVLLFIPRLFGLEFFPAEQLKDYLGDLRKRRGPVGSLFSDNKARACVKREKELGPYDVDTKTWLIQDMLDGWTSPLDEGAIITLLRRSPADLQKIVTAVGRDHLWSKFGGKNRRIIEAMTMTAADAGEALVTRLRDLSPEELQDYSKNSSDPAVLESVRRATALSKITAPVPAKATITADNKAQITINRVEITFLPDGIDASLGNHAMTYALFSPEEPTPIPDTPENAHTTYDGTTPFKIRLKIWTNFASEEAKSGSSGYGAGSTLREHERSHGKGWIDFVTQNAPPQFPGRQNMSAAELNSAAAQYHTALEDYHHRAGDFALRAGDCSVPGRLPTDAQLAGTGFTAAICDKQPETAGQAPAAPTSAPAAPAPATPTPAPTVQPKLEVGTTTDPLEREADRVAEQVSSAPGFLPVSGKSRVEANSAPAMVRDVLHFGGKPLDHATRSFFEPRFRHDFSRVRIHSDAQAAASARSIGALAYTSGNNVVFNSDNYSPNSTAGRKLLAHELTHVVQQNGDGGPAANAPRSVQRKILLNKTEMDDKARTDFLAAHKSAWGSNAPRASQIMAEMAAAGDSFDFEDDAELVSEIVKRISTVTHMEESQPPEKKVPGHLNTAFGYPFNPGTEIYGPRVNFAAKDYWTPGLADNYALRTDKAKIKKALSLPRSQRHTVFGDQSLDVYFWKLSDKGKADPYTAIKNLFQAQQPHKRSLFHCDYLISVVNLMSLADSMGKDEFNKRIAAYGVDKIVLNWNLFKDLHAETKLRDPKGEFTGGNVPGLKSTRRVTPSTEKDLIIGDHVVFTNHLAYDLINETLGHPWRLENAVFVKREGKENVYLGHGSGYQTDATMRSTLASAFNKVADIALPLIDQAKSHHPKTRAAGEDQLKKKFPSIQRVGNEFHAKGQTDLACSPVDFKVDDITKDKVVGLHDPCDLSAMHWVERPIESAPGKANP